MEHFSVEADGLAHIKKELRTEYVVHPH